MEKHSLKIHGMSGDHCIMVIKNIVAKIDGAKPDYIETGHAHIQLDESKTSRAAVVAAIEKMGYKVEQ